MKNDQRDLLVLLKTPAPSAEAFEKHIECLHQLLVQVETDTVFCTAHELAQRFSISQKRKAILKAVVKEVLKPFCFLINKN